MKRLFFHEHIKMLAVLIFFIFTVAIFYGNTLQNDFVFDNHETIEQDIYLHSLKYIPRAFTTATVLYYRPIGLLSVILTYQISSLPWIFHLVNLIYFVAAGFLVFILVKLLTKNFFVAFCSGFIFLIHPINSEAVNWIAESSSLATAFILLTIIFFFLYRHTQKSIYLTLVYLFYALGILTKELAILTPLILFTLDVTFFKQKISSFFHWKYLKPYVYCLISFLVCMGLRSWALKGLDSAAGVTHTLNTAQGIYYFFYSFAQYIQKVFWPYPLTFLYGSPSTYRFLSVNFLIAISITAGYLGLCIYAWKKKLFTILLGLVWFSVFLLPILAFVNSLIVMFAERYVFISTVGFSIIIASFLDWLWKKGKRQKIAVAVFISIISILSFVIVYQRNRDWKSDIAMYQYELQRDPNSDALHYNLATAYSDKGDLTSAKKELEQVINMGPGTSLSKAYNNLGDIYRKEGKLDSALQYFALSIKADPNHKEAYNNFGALLMEKGDILKSVSNLCKALLIDQNYKEANTNFNAAASQIQGLDNKTLMLLYDQILQGSIYKPASTKNVITLKTKDCSLPQGCLLIFSSTLPKNEFLFPFLTVGKTALNEVVRSRYFEFNPQTSEIALGIDHQFGSSSIHFWFPTCDGVYYEAETPIQ